MGYALSSLTWRSERYVLVAVVMESGMMLETGGGIHDWTSGRNAAISLPRKRIALTLSVTAFAIIAGTNPRRSYWKTTRESADTGSGLKKPVSALLRASISWLLRS